MSRGFLRFEAILGADYKGPQAASLLIKLQIKKLKPGLIWMTDTQARIRLVKCLKDNNHTHKPDILTGTNMEMNVIYFKL